MVGAAAKLTPAPSLYASLAQRSGLGRQWIGKVLTGRGNASLATIRKIAAAAGVAPCDVVAFIEDAKGRRK